MTIQIKTGKAMAKDFEIAFHCKAKNAILWQAACKLGSVSALAKHLGVTLSVVHKWVNLQACPPIFADSHSKWSDAQILNLEVKLHAITGRSLEDIFPEPLHKSKKFLAQPKTFCISSKMPAIDLIEQRERTTQLLTTLLGRLEPRTREVISLRFSLDGQPLGSDTLDTVAKKLGVSRERVAQIERKGLRQMQHYAAQMAAESAAADAIRNLGLKQGDMIPDGQS